MRILIAPDKFKGTLPADRVAEAMARGARKVHPDASFVLRPAADGGEGTVEAFLIAQGGRVRDVEVTGPNGQTVVAPVARTERGTTVIEMASASGLALRDVSLDAATSAHTFGTGELLRAACGEGGRVVLGVGGSASTDGGTGAARAWGWRFLDAAGEELPLGGGALERLVHIEPPAERVEVDLSVACDVDNPLLGDKGSARFFAPQKGADTDAVELLERGLEQLARVISTDLGLDVGGLPHGGAGGGMGAGAVAFFGAALSPGFDLLADETGLRTEVDAADLVITGEGRLDHTSFGGKAPVSVARMAAGSHTPCLGVVGDLQAERSELKRNGFETVVGLIQTGGGSLAESDPEIAIERATEGVLRLRLEKKKGRSLRR